MRGPRGRRGPARRARARPAPCHGDGPGAGAGPAHPVNLQVVDAAEVQLAIATRVFWRKHSSQLARRPGWPGFWSPGLCSPRVGPADVPLRTGQDAEWAAEQTTPVSLPAEESSGPGRGLGEPSVTGLKMTPPVSHPSLPWLGRQHDPHGPETWALPAVCCPSPPPCRLLSPTRTSRRPEASRTLSSRSPALQPGPCKGHLGASACPSGPTSFS